MSQPECSDAANQSEWNIHQHQQCLACRSKRCIEQTKDDDDHQRNDEHQALRRALLIFKLPAILDEITERKLNFLRDSRPHFGNETSQIASAHIGHHNDTPLAVLAVDHFSRTADINSSQITESGLLTAR